MMTRSIAPQVGADRVKLLCWQGQSHPKLALIGFTSKGSITPHVDSDRVKLLARSIVPHIGFDRVTLLARSIAPHVGCEGVNAGNVN